MKRFITIAMLFLLLFPLPAQRKNKSKQVQSENRIFSDLDKEYKVVSYFLNYQQKKYYHSLKDETEQSAYLASFWKAYNPNPISKKNDFLILIRERIAYCNTHFSHFNDGWETDRGRIYIRYGEPFDILKGRTSIQTRHTVKDYQIWKYRMDPFITYIFLDQQGHGDFKIIYCDGDDKEATNPDWIDLLGPDFDIQDLL